MWRHDPTRALYLEPFPSEHVLAVVKAAVESDIKRRDLAQAEHSHNVVSKSIADSIAKLHLEPRRSDHEDQSPHQDSTAEAVNEGIQSAENPEPYSDYTEVEESLESTTEDLQSPELALVQNPATDAANGTLEPQVNTLTEFLVFNNLPPELQIKILRLALSEPRNVFVTFYYRKYTYGSPIRPNNIWFCSFPSAPALLSVSHFTRQVVLSTYQTCIETTRAHKTYMHSTNDTLVLDIIDIALDTEEFFRSPFLDCFVHVQTLVLSVYHIAEDSIDRQGATPMLVNHFLGLKTLLLNADSEVFFLKMLPATLARTRFRDITKIDVEHGYDQLLNEVWTFMAKVMVAMLEAGRDVPEMWLVKCEVPARG